MKNRLMMSFIIPAFTCFLVVTISCERKAVNDSSGIDDLLQVDSIGFDDASNAFYGALAKLDLATTNSYLSRSIFNLPLNEYYCPKRFSDFYGVDIWRPVHKKAVVLKWADAQVEGFWITVEFLKTDAIKVETNQGSSTWETGPSLVRSDLWLRESGDWKIIPQEASSNLAWVVFHDSAKLGAINSEEDLVAEVDDAKTVLQERNNLLEKMAKIRKLEAEKNFRKIQATHNLQNE